MAITQRIDAVTLVPDAYRHPVVPAPKSVKIELTGRCNYRCGFCALRTREQQPTEADDMSFELFKRITYEMREAGVEEIGLFYLGESFMNFPLLLEACEWVKKGLEMPYAFLTTNGSLATPDRVKQLMEAGLDSLKFSINAADFVQFEEVMGVGAKNYHKALQNLELAWGVRERYKLKTKLYASYIQFDGEQKQRMASLIDAYVKPYVDEVYALPLYSMGMYAERVKERIGYMPTFGNQGRIDQESGIGNRAHQKVCWAIMTEGHVRADGHLSACCFGADDKFDVGNLTKQSFMEAWNSQEFQDIRNAHLRNAAGDADALKGSMCECCVAWT